MSSTPLEIRCEQGTLQLLDNGTLRLLAHKAVEWEVPAVWVSSLAVQTSLFSTTPVIHTIIGSYSPGRMTKADFAKLCTHFPQVPMILIVIAALWTPVALFCGLCMLLLISVGMGINRLAVKLGEPIFLSMLSWGLPDIGELERDQNVKALILALRNKKQERDVRQNAAAALGRIKDLRAVEPLIAALQDEEWAVRWSAATALGWISDPRAIEPLTALLQDKEKHVRQATTRVLDQIG